jgi:hypothetical protein
LSLRERWKPSRGDARVDGAVSRDGSSVSDLETPPPLSSDVERARVLHLALRRWQAEGAVVESAGAHQAVVRWGRTTSHHRHLIASVCSLGCWLPVWLVVARVRAAQRRTTQVTVDEFGRITSRTLDPTRPAR